MHSNTHDLGAKKSAGPIVMKMKLWLSLSLSISIQFTTGSDGRRKAVGLDVCSNNIVTYWRAIGSWVIPQLPRVNVYILISTHVSRRCSSLRIFKKNRVWGPRLSDSHLTQSEYDHVRNQRVQYRVDPVDDFDIVRDMVATPETTRIPPDFVARAVHHEKPLEWISVFMQDCDETP